MSGQKWIRNWFSNFEPFEQPVVYQEIVFKYPENMYQALKTHKSCIDIRRMLASLSPGESKRWWRKGNNKHKYLREDWLDISLDVMEYILRLKFAEGTIWYHRLIETKGRIVETNNWHDNFYGECICEKCKNKPKYNHLGLILMKIRDGQ